MGVVAAGHPHTARAGALTLARGGGAVDAVCAAAFAAAVAESPLTGPAAGGFLLARSPEGVVTLLDFFVAAPGLGPAGRRLDARDLDSFTVPFGGAEQVFHIGPASVAVPGMVAGLGEAASRLGRLPLADLVEPGVRLARDGVILGREAAYLHEILADMLRATPAAAAVYAPGRLLGEGDRLRLPDLAETLAHLGQAGPGSMRDGPLAAAIVEHLAVTGGLVTAEDLRDYRVVERRPLQTSYRGLTLLTNPPPSSGGALIAVALSEAEQHPPPRGDVEHYRTVARAGAVANALRGPEFDRDLQEEDAIERLWARRMAGPEGADRWPVSRKPTGSTTHISAVDGQGGMASLSSSNGSGSGVVVPGTGILLNNMLGEEDLNPGGFGRLTPGARMTSMMAPTLLLRGDEPVLALGSAGSNRLRSAILQAVISAVDGGLGASDAVRRPRVHPEGDGVDVEGGVGEEAVAALVADGHRVRRWGATSLFFGGVSLAGSGPHGLEGAGDPRRGGAAAGVTASGEVIDL